MGLGPFCSARRSVKLLLWYAIHNVWSLQFGTFRSVLEIDGLTSVFNRFGERCKMVQVPCEYYKRAKIVRNIHVA